MEDLIRLFYYYDDMREEARENNDKERYTMYNHLKNYVSSIIEGML